MRILHLLCVSALLFAPAPQQAHPAADRILILKSAHTMELLSHGQILKTYKVALGDPHG